MVIALLLACGGAGEAPEKPSVELEVVTDVEPSAPAPLTKTRALRLSAAWDAGTPRCEPPCATVEIAGTRASTERAGQGPSGAVDGVLGTSWCGQRGVRDQLMVRFDRPYDLESLVLHAPGLAAVEVISSEWDQARIDLGAHPGGEVAAPWVDLGFAGAEYVNIEVKALQENGRPCITELAFTGIPSAAGAP